MTRYASTRTAKLEAMRVRARELREKREARRLHEPRDTDRLVERIMAQERRRPTAAPTITTNANGEWMSVKAPPRGPGPVIVHSPRLRGTVQSSEPRKAQNAS